MSEITFACPLCRHDIQCGAQFRGHQLECPICHGQITVPQPIKASPLAVKVPWGEKNTPNIPMLQQKAVVHEKRSMRKIFKPVAVVVLVLVILFFIAKVTGFDSKIPFLAKSTGEGGEQNASAPAKGAAPAPTPAAETAVAAPAPPPPPPTPVVWTTNLAGVVISTNAVYGKISTIDFKYDNARVDNGILVLRQGTNAVPDMEMGVQFGLKAGENLAGKIVSVALDTRAPLPRVWKKWKLEGKTTLQVKSFSKGYVMNLQFGDVTDDKVNGKIFICLPDEEQSVVAGSFVATVGQAIAAVAAAAQPATPASSSMSEEMKRRYAPRGGSPTPGSSARPGGRPTRP